ncbi:MAG: NADH-quinone oxidoreductase subunit C, partial [Longimicrobiales bacterium]
AHPSVAALRERFGDAVLHHTVASRDEHVVYIVAARVVEVLGWLKDEAAHRYDLLTDLTAVDYGGGRPLEVVYQLWSIEHRRALRLKATLPLDALEIGSVYDLWRAADWMEREVFDLFGIHFRGHPDLRRILMPENYAEGHPLRKDFPLRGRFSRAEQTRRALAMPVEEYYTPQELRIAHDAGSPPPPNEVFEHPAPPGPPAEPQPGRAAGGPKQAEDWEIGTSGSAAGGAPGPEGVTE